MTTPSRRLITILQYLAFASVLLGTKLWLISTYGNGTPYWDQWDGEAMNLYKPFFENTLGWRELLAPHNEHRILTTRLFALAQLFLNGIWNPLFQMVTNALLHIFTLALLIHLLTRVIGRVYLIPLLAFSVLLFSPPFAWENTLAGFQSGFYFVLLFSTLSLWFVTLKEPLSIAWFFGIFWAILAFFSLASGAFVFAAGAFLGALFYLLKIRKNKSQLTAILILFILFFISVALTPVLPHHASLKASSLLELIDALKSTLSWPASSGYLAVILRNLPVLIFIHAILKKCPPANDKRWYLFALIVWMLGTALSVAYGRAAGATASRYLDLFAIAILVNFACLISIIKDQLFKKKKRSQIYAGLWVIMVFISLGLRVAYKTPDELAAKRATGQAQELNTKNFLATGDFSHLKDKPFLHVPYPDPQRLATILTTPEVRSILPANITGVSPSNGKMDTSVTWLLSNFFLAIGLGILIAVALATHWFVKKPLNR